MAEAFARSLGSDVLEAHSAGIRPASRISQRTALVMAEKGILLASSHATKSISTLPLNEFDLIVNLSEYSLPDTSTMVLKRALRDPMQGDEDAFRDVREDVEQIVRFLVEHFRLARQWHTLNQWGSGDPLYSDVCALASSSV
jgi:arsenate reductase